MSTRSLTTVALLGAGGWLIGFLSGCDSGGGAPAVDLGAGDGGGSTVIVGARPSRSSTIAISDDEALVAMVNPEDDSLAIFRTSDNTRTAKVTTGDEPSSVVLSPDGKSAFVANRGAATVVRVDGLDGATPTVAATVDVGSEPVGLALSPTGARLFVAEMAEGRVSVVDTATMTISASIDAPDRPRALLVTNDGDADDTDELLIVPEFYGEPTAEAKDDGRTGRVRVYQLSDLAPTQAITFAPLDSGVQKAGAAAGTTVKTAPNQLWSVSTRGGRLYVTSVSASPEGPTRFDNNVFPVVYVGDLATRAELTGPGGTTNLARKVLDAIPAPTAAAPRFIPGELVDMEFVPNTNVAYAVARAADLVQRVVWDDANVTIGSTQNKQIDLAGNDQVGRCQAPTGIALNAKASRAYVNCWVTRRLGVIDLGAQALVATVEAAPAAQAADDQSVARGRRFYFTGRGRWSNAGTNGAKGGEGWSSCGSCHPDGLSDNITWIFASGPRQTTSQDGSFSHGSGVQKQRIFNWTGIFDEHHDFERNTRDVSGGLGAITRVKTGAGSSCATLDDEEQVPLRFIDAADGNKEKDIPGLGRPLKELADDPLVASCGHKDWDDIDNFVKTIRPPRARRFADAAQVARGRQLFVDGGCAKCHGGAGWTVSRRYWVPEGARNATLASTNVDLPGVAGIAPLTGFVPTWVYAAPGNSARKHLGGQPPIPSDDTGDAEAAAIAIAQAACSLRNVGTFGVLKNATLTDPLELRPFKDPSTGVLSFVRAQGRGGYNVPSLYGVALGAPYLHHGQAKTLRELFTDAQYAFHTNAGNGNFSVQLAMSASNVDDLAAFLTSIDATTVELAIPNDPTNASRSFDVCPATF